MPIKHWPQIPTAGFRVAHPAPSRITLVVFASLVLSGVLLFAPRTTLAITCGFGTDIGGGVCRGFLTTTGSNQTFTSPSDWNNSNNTIECIGAGGSGGAVRGSTTNDATGGGGGAIDQQFQFCKPGSNDRYISYRPRR